MSNTAEHADVYYVGVAVLHLFTCVLYIHSKISLPLSRFLTFFVPCSSFKPLDVISCGYSVALLRLHPQSFKMLVHHCKEELSEDSFYAHNYFFVLLLCIISLSMVHNHININSQGNYVNRCRTHHECHRQVQTHGNVQKHCITKM